MPATLVVGTNTYVTLVEADAYLDDSLAASSTWGFLDDDTKNRALLTAFRLLERQSWLGDPVGDTAFPAIGVTDCEGNEVPEDEVPQDIEDAQVELAYSLTLNPSLEALTTTDDNTRRLQAGSASIEFFNRDGVIVPTRFPGNVMELIRCYLSSASGSDGAEAIGADGETIFGDCDDYDRHLPF